MLSLFLVGHVYLRGNMVRLVFMNEHKKIKCYDEIGLCAQKMLP